MVVGNESLARSELIAVLQEQGKLAEVNAYYPEAVAGQRKLSTKQARLREAQLLGEWARLLGQQGKLEEAEARCHEAIAAARKVDDPQALVNRLATSGDFLRDQGKGEQAKLVYREGLELCRRASPINGEDEQWLASGLGQVLKAQGKLAEAEGYYREAVTNSARLHPNDPARWQWQLNDLADLLRSQGKSAEADKLLADLIAPASLGQPQSAGALRIRADSFGRQGHWQDVAADLKKLLELDSSDVHIHLQLATVLARTGDLESYRTHCRSIVARFSTTNDPGVLDQAAKACLLLPEAVTNLETLGQMAAKALTLGQGNPWFSFFQMDNGLAQYRRGA